MSDVRLILGGAAALFCDGHVEFLGNDLEQPTFNALLTRSGGETIDAR